MVRRPLNTLVEQGLLPSPKTSPFLHEQRQKLELARKGDLLRSKIARRPDRSELVNKHILEDVPAGVDPSLCDVQRQLKRAKLADTLSNQLQMRPGPLELVKKNILHLPAADVGSEAGDEGAAGCSEEAADHLEQAVKQGQIQFRPTKEGVPTVHVALPDRYSVGLSFDEDSNSEGVLSPQQQATPSPASASGGVVKSESTDSVFSVPGSSQDSSGSGHTRRSSDLGAFAVPSPPGLATTTTSAATPTTINFSYSKQRAAPGKDAASGSRKKKVKQSKSIGERGGGKARTIKFHEYKGPPSTERGKRSAAAAAASSSSEEISSGGGGQKSEEDTRYELLLKQQQLFLQWQLELSHKVISYDTYAHECCLEICQRNLLTTFLF